MRSYGQFCAAARALDVIGDRWSLLLVRELMLRDCRFTDLRRGLPGVATNLLTERLRDLEAAGVLERTEAPPPVATTLYRLTERGRALEPVLHELVRWGLPEMLRGPGEDEARGHWVVAALPVLYEGADLAPLAPFVVAVEADGDALAFAIAEGGELHLGDAWAPAGAPDATVRGAAHDVVAALGGNRAALGRLTVEGDARRLADLVSRATVHASAERPSRVHPST